MPSFIVMTIEDAKNLNIITINKLLGSLISHENTLKRERKENEVDKNKMKDLASTIDGYFGWT